MLILLPLLFALSAAQRQCGPNEVYHAECGTACEPNCNDPAGPMACIAVCVPDVCQCKPGYKRSATGTCVRPKKCAASEKCGTNEEFKECGSACEPKCSDPPGPRICPAMCLVNVCQCKQGYKRNAKGACVPATECSSADTKQCGPNEEFRQCGTACEPKCSDPPGPRACPAVCKLNVCQCKPGYKRDGKGMCVPETQCKQCPSNEVFKDCGTACEPSCTNPKPQICTEQCVAECQCMEGFLRNAAGVCVRQDACSSKKCPTNEVFKECGTACEPSCKQPKPQFCTFQCVIGCQCQNGYLRDSSGKCVQQSQCASQDDNDQCQPNEVRQDCGSPCDPTCDNPLGADQCVVARSCIPNKCECKPGLVRKDGKCVPQTECTKCGKNERVFGCEPCEGTCENPNPRCPRICRKTNKCHCRRDFVRKDGNCVPQSECKAQGDDQGRCRNNEVFKTCGGCDGSCSTPNPICTMQCRPPKCQCKQGYVRGFFNRCIPVERCDRNPFQSLFTNRRDG